MAFEKIDLSVLKPICDILGDTNKGFTGSEIGSFLEDYNIPDVMTDCNKRTRLYGALKAKQESDGCGDHVFRFLQEVMHPSRHTEGLDWFNDTLLKINTQLIFIGYELGKDGKIRKASEANTIEEARDRVDQFKRKLMGRGVHPDILRFCKKELLEDKNYFHAVLEASKSIADKIRNKTSLSGDGSSLIETAFTLSNDIPYLAINTLTTETDRGEQRGFMNLLKGLMGCFRNPTAHNPRITWEINEKDALDILSFISLLHRKLDNATNAKETVSNSSYCPKENKG